MAISSDSLTFINQLAATSLRLSGVIRDQAIPTADEVAAFLMYANATLAEWSENSIYIYFVTQISFIGQPNILYYFIGPGAAATVKQNAFVNISNITYQIGAVVYTPYFLEKIDFDKLPYKNVSSMPMCWTYQVNQDDCQVGFYPKTVGGEIIHVSGKQRLTSLEYFQDGGSSVPDSVFLPLVYRVAQHLANHYNAKPASGFYSELEKQEDFLISNNRNVASYNNPPPFSTNKFGGGAVGMGSGISVF
jgi:hypothetical protein